MAKIIRTNATEPKLPAPVADKPVKAAKAVTAKATSKPVKKATKAIVVKRDAKPSVKRSASDIAFRALQRKDGVTATALQKATGWVRKPTSFDLKAMAARWQWKLSSTENKAGETVYKIR